MNDIQWTSDQIANEFTECRTIGELIRRLENMVAARGEVICEIRVNGHLLDEADETKFAQDPCSGISELTVRTDRPEALIHQAMISTLSFIPLLTKASLDTATLFRSGEVGKASEQLEEALEGYQWFVETIHHARGAASGMGTPVVGIERWHEAEKVLHKAVSELTTTFDRKDYVIAADVLEYELTAALEMWEPVLRSESERREAAATAIP